MHQRSAQGWARTRLVQQHLKEYQELYQQLKGNYTGENARSRAATKARIILVNKYYKEYREFREVAVSKGYLRRNS